MLEINKLTNKKALFTLYKISRYLSRYGIQYRDISRYAFQGWYPALIYCVSKDALFVDINLLFLNIDLYDILFPI